MDDVFGTEIAMSDESGWEVIGESVEIKWDDAESTGTILKMRLTLIQNQWKMMSQKRRDTRIFYVLQDIYNAQLQPNIIF